MLVSTVNPASTSARRIEVSAGKRVHGARIGMKIGSTMCATMSGTRRVIGDRGGECDLAGGCRREVNRARIR